MSSPRAAKTLAAAKCLRILAAPQGFEPRYADPESAVLAVERGGSDGFQAIRRRSRNTVNGSFLFYGSGQTTVNRIATHSRRFPAIDPLRAFLPFTIKSSSDSFRPHK
jgi:hypothetical protein